MILFKACPRCRTGDMTLAEDIYGKYLQCFQCGHVLYPKAGEAAVKTQAASTSRERIAA